jgi:hypothetical protein
MIAVDTNAWRRYLGGTIDSYTPLIAEAVNYGEAVFPPIVLTEALSHRLLTPEDLGCIDSNIPLLTYDDGFTRFVDAGLELL